MCPDQPGREPGSAARESAARVPDHAGRRATLRSILMEHGVDGLLVTDPANVRYLTGFTGVCAALLVCTWDTRTAEDRTVLATDGRYRDRIRAQSPDLTAEIAGAVDRRLVELAGEWKLGRIGYESHVVTVDQHRGFLDQHTGLDFVATPGLVEQLRVVKEPYELARLRAAGVAADGVLATLLARQALRPGRTERAVGMDVAAAVFEHGADVGAREIVVAAGRNSAAPQHRPSEAVLARGDLVRVDFAVTVAGYHVNLARTFVLGPPTDWQRAAHALVERSRAAGMAVLHAGAVAAEVDAAARAVVAESGHAKLFVHPFGHGVGLRIQEAPGIAKTATGTLLAGVAVAVEPGVYWPDRGGVRIADTLVVRCVEAGGLEPLTNASTELIVVG
ncbi:M24 family metallopeptidase [Nocardia callitridis]|uniref:Xaa-Pro peptidase family protein n=1 Tax=Nocardia callitridis TaxID=648753 RepID=A0ABP9KDH5_9NOCA